MFNSRELQLLISGDQRAIDMEDLKKHVQYASGYHPSQPYVQAFWEIVENMSPSDQGQFLKFVTSCSRQPLLGFSQLAPAFCIQQVPMYADRRQLNPNPNFGQGLSEVLGSAGDGVDIGNSNISAPMDAIGGDEADEDAMDDGEEEVDEEEAQFRHAVELSRREWQRRGPSRDRRSAGGGVTTAENRVEDGLAHEHEQTESSSSSSSSSSALLPPPPPAVVPLGPAAKLPTAATCMNLLKLPKYDSVEMLKEKLLYAIRSNSGFELS